MFCEMCNMRNLQANVVPLELECYTNETNAQR